MKKVRLLYCFHHFSNSKHSLLKNKKRVYNFVIGVSQDESRKRVNMTVVKESI